MKLEQLERELIERGYRIRYRRPDDHFIWTYQLERDSMFLGGFRITEQALDQATCPSALVTHLERNYGWPRTP